MPDNTARTSRTLPLVLPGVTGFYLAARLCITFLFFQSDPKMGAYANFVLHFALLAVVALFSFGPAGIPASRLRTRPRQWVLAFLLLGLISLCWSITASLPIAFAYWCELVTETGIIILVFRVDPVREVSHAIVKGYVLGAVAVAAVAWLSPTMYDLRPGDDAFFSPNAIGFTCAFAFFLKQIFLRSTGLSQLVAAFLAVSLLRSLSKTTIVAFVVAQGVLLVRDHSRNWRAKSAITLAAAAVVSLFWRLIEDYFDVYTHLGNQSETLSGRIGIWAYVLARSLEQPWLGHGFHSFRNVIPPFGTFEAWHAHNEILQQFYAYGVLGIVLVGGVYGSFLLQCQKTKSPVVRARFVALLIFILIRGLADTENFDLSLPLWSIAMMSVWLANVPEREQVTEPADSAVFSLAAEFPGSNSSMEVQAP